MHLQATIDQKLSRQRRSGQIVDGGVNLKRSELAKPRISFESLLGAELLEARSMFGINDMSSLSQP